VGGVVVLLAGRTHLSCLNMRHWITIGVDIQSFILEVLLHCPLKTVVAMQFFGTNKDVSCPLGPILGPKLAATTTSSLTRCHHTLCIGSVLCVSKLGKRYGLWAPLEVSSPAARKS
jgi:hypothetical protein